MQFIDFRDTCVIRRNKGGKDDFGNPLTKTVYDGPCNYQEGGQQSYGIITRSPTMYLPSNDIIIEINDAVTVNTEAGRVINSLVKVARDVRLRATRRLDITRIELKQATDEQKKL